MHKHIVVNWLSTVSAKEQPSFSHFLFAEYEAAGSEGEEKGAKRGEETNRG